MGNMCDNYLRASGTERQVVELVAKICAKFGEAVYDENPIESGENLFYELNFNSSFCFPKDEFKAITDSHTNTKGLYIRVSSDEPASNYLEQSIYEDSKWNFEKSDTDLTQKAPVSTLTRYSDDKYAYATGAFLQRVSYINLSGKRVFGWIVTGFEADTYRNGVYLEVEADADTLEGLTPPEEAELKDTEHIDFE